MIVESALTAFSKYRFQKDLQLTTGLEVPAPRPRPGKEYLLYVHVPFCEELCPYCSFNRFKLDKDLAREYLRALTVELRMYADLGFDFRSIYVGGGTPTVLPQEIGRLLHDARDMFRIQEISLETNPNHLIEPIIGILKEAGVNRLSVGVQSFDDGLLKKMERYHKYGSGAKIKETLAGLMGSFDTLNVDMIFNFPGQSIEMIDTDLDIIQEIRADQVTFYPLMVSDMTRGQLARTFGPISYRTEKLLYNRIAQRLRGSHSLGTAWCFSRKKSMIDEYIIDYDEYAGAGSGSFGYLNGSVLANTFSVEQYIADLNNGRLPLMAKKDFSVTQQMRYDFMMKLFGTSLDLAKAEKKFNGRFAGTLRKEIALFRLLSAVTIDNGFLRLTPKGQYLWVIMMREFFTGVNNFRDLCRGGMKNEE